MHLFRKINERLTQIFIFSPLYLLIVLQLSFTKWFCHFECAVGKSVNYFSMFEEHHLYNSKCMYIEIYNFKGIEHGVLLTGNINSKNRQKKKCSFICYTIYKMQKKRSGFVVVSGSQPCHTAKQLNYGKVAKKKTTTNSTSNALMLYVSCQYIVTSICIYQSCTTHITVWKIVCDPMELEMQIE